MRGWKQKKHRPEMRSGWSAKARANAGMKNSTSDSNTDDAIHDLKTSKSQAEKRHMDSVGSRSVRHASRAEIGEKDARSRQEAGNYATAARTRRGED
jgi:hypothetical protein